MAILTTVTMSASMSEDNIVDLTMQAQETKHLRDDSNISCTVQTFVMNDSQENTIVTGEKSQMTCTSNQVQWQRKALSVISIHCFIVFLNLM